MQCFQNWPCPTWDKGEGGRAAPCARARDPADGRAVKRRPQRPAAQKNIPCRLPTTRRLRALPLVLVPARNPELGVASTTPRGPSRLLLLVRPSVCNPGLLIWTTGLLGGRLLLLLLWGEGSSTPQPAALRAAACIRPAAPQLTAPPAAALSLSIHWGVNAEGSSCEAEGRSCCMICVARPRWSLLVGSRCEGCLLGCYWSSRGDAETAFLPMRRAKSCFVRLRAGLRAGPPRPQAPAPLPSFRRQAPVLASAQPKGARKVLAARTTMVFSTAGRCVWLRKGGHPGAQRHSARVEPGASGLPPPRHCARLCMHGHRSWACG